MSSRTASTFGFIRSAAVIGLIAIALFPTGRPEHHTRSRERPQCTKMIRRLHADRGRSPMLRLRPASLTLLTNLALLVLLAGGALAAWAGRSAAASTRSSSAGAPRAGAGADGGGSGETVDLDVV